MANLTVSAWQMPPIPQDVLDQLPPRMAIANRNRARQSVTHSSLYGLPSNPNSLGLANTPLDYQKLEHVGDSVVGFAVTTIMYRKYANLKEGPSTALRGQVCSNQTLSQLAVHLGIVDLLEAHYAQETMLRGLTKTQADLFEAHIGALAIGDNGLLALSPEVTAYLEAIFDPVVEWAYGAMLAHQQDQVVQAGSAMGTGGGPHPYDVDKAAVGAKMALDQYFARPIRGRYVTWVPEDPLEPGPPFTAYSRVDRKGKCFLTSATRDKKALAVAAAAWEMLGELGLPRNEPPV